MVYVPENPLAMRKKKNAKFKNKTCKAQGKKFDSMLERDRFFFLQEQQKRGFIKNLRCQVRFSLDVNGEHICDYVSDFIYDTDRICVVEDVKSSATEKLSTFVLKKKLMKACHGIEIKIVKSSTLPI